MKYYTEHWIILQFYFSPTTIEMTFLAALRI